MKNLTRIILFGAFCIASAGALSAQELNQRHVRRTMQPFEHLAVSIHGSTLGFGFEVATPLYETVNLRAGFTTMPRVSFSYIYDGIGDNGDPFSVDMSAGFRWNHGNILIDWSPVRDGRFYVTGGAFFGSNRLLQVDARTDYREPIEIGGVWVTPDEYGSVTAWAQTNAVKPYLGLGFGRTIPRTSVSVKFEIGALYQGVPKILTDNDTINQGTLDEADRNTLDNVLRYARFYPMLSLRIAYRIF